MKLTNFAPTILLLVGCSRGIKPSPSDSSAAGLNHSQKSQTQKRYQIVLQIDDGLPHWLKELHKTLLMPDASGEVYFNPSDETELISLNPGLPDLRFHAENFGIPLLSVKSWLLTSKESGNALHLNLLLPSNFHRTGPLRNSSPTLMNKIALINLLKLRIEEALSPQSFTLDSNATQKIETEELTDTQRPFFFSLENPYPKKSLFGQSCIHAESYLYALQLSKMIKPEASFEIELICQISTVNFNEPQSKTGITLLNLALPWKKPETELALFNSPKDFFIPEKYPTQAGDSGR